MDREALDEEVHNLDFLVDSARRICHLAVGDVTMETADGGWWRFKDGQNGWLKREVLKLFFGGLYQKR